MKGPGSLSSSLSCSLFGSCHFDVFTMVADALIMCLVVLLAAPSIIVLFHDLHLQWVINHSLFFFAYFIVTCYVSYLSIIVLTFLMRSTLMHSNVYFNHPLTHFIQLLRAHNCFDDPNMLICHQNSFFLSSFCYRSF